MKNLAAVVTKKALIDALEDAFSNNRKLTPSTKFQISYKNRVFPPKAIVRLAAEKMGIKNLSEYRLHGGESTNKKLIEKGFEIIQFAEWQKRNLPDETDVHDWKITRLTYNSNGWISPSGLERKSKVPGLHEADYGFGHEEWLFDFSKKISGFKYGFIEGLRTKNNKHAGSIFNLQLFTIDNIEKEKYWVATIENCYVLSVKEQLAALDQFVKKGWLKEQEDQLRAKDIWTSKTSQSLKTFAPNVRFSEKDVTFFDPPIPVIHNTFIDSRDRYLLYDWDDSAEIESDTDLPFAFISSQPNQDKTVVRLGNSNFQSKEIKQLHRQIAAALYKSLLKTTNPKNIACDLPNSEGTYIDMVKVEGNQYVLYEIKTYTQLRKNIREAIGQLMEYAFWTRNKKIKELVIVSEKTLDKKAGEYLAFLRKNFSLQISYLQQEI